MEFILWSYKWTLIPRRSCPFRSMLGVAILLVANVLLDNVSLAHDVTMTFSMCSNAESFLTIWNVAVMQCKTECDSRPKCLGANYRRLLQRCDLMETDEQGNLTSHIGCLYIRRDSKKQLPDGCQGSDCQVCFSQDNDNHCEIKECERVYSTQSTAILGNRQLVGSKLVSVCTPGHMFLQGGTYHQHECRKENGTWSPPIEQCVPVTCQTLAKVNASSGEYDAFDEGSETVIKIFCEFRADHGYTFLSNDTFRNDTNLDKYYTRTDYVMVRHLRQSRTASNETAFVQKEGTMSLLNRYKSEGNITVMSNGHLSNFADPDCIHAPYIYLHLAPKEFEFKQNDKIGYNFETKDVDKSSKGWEKNNSYLVVHTGPDLSTNSSLSKYIVRCPNATNKSLYSPMGCPWIDDARDVNNTRYLPRDFFFFYSIHIGGDGVLLYSVKHTNDDYDVLGVALGFRFDY